MRLPARPASHRPLMAIGTQWTHDEIHEIRDGRAPPGGYRNPLEIQPGGGTRPEREPMNWPLLLRAGSSLALPAAFGAAWWQRRNTRPRPVEPLGEPGEQMRMRPTKRDLRRMISDGERLADLDLRRAPLKGVDLHDRDISGSDLTGADLREANLRGVDLSRSVLDFADLSGADLTAANLAGATLVDTSLWNADLRGADLRAVRNIVMANLKRATFDGATIWPGRLDPESLGAVKSNARRSG